MSQEQEDLIERLLRAQAAMQARQLRLTAFLTGSRAVTEALERDMAQQLYEAGDEAANNYPGPRPWTKE